MGGPKFGICLCIDVVLHFVIQTNMLLQLGQIHLAIWTNTFDNTSWRDDWLAALSHKLHLVPQPPNLYRNLDKYIFGNLEKYI